MPIKNSGIIHTVAGQQPQKSPSLLHTAGTPQSHLSLGLNSNMTVTSKTKLFIIHNLCVSGGERTKRPRAVLAVRGEPGVWWSETKRNVLVSPEPAHL